MSELTIYCEGKNRPIQEAIGVLTDDWIDSGNCCDQTKIDLRDAVKQLMSINAELLAALEAIVKHQTAIAGTLAEFSGIVNIAKAAIAKAQSFGGKLGE